MTSRFAEIDLAIPNRFQGRMSDTCLVNLYRSVEQLLQRLGSDKSQCDLDKVLPAVHWSLCDGVPGYVTIHIFARPAPDQDLSSFIFEMVNARLFSGRYVEIFTFQDVVFNLPELKSGDLLYISTTIHVDRQAELAELTEALPSLAPDLELGMLIPELITPLQQTLLPERSADLARIRCDSIRWLYKWDDTSPVELLRWSFPLASALQKPFLEVRSNRHLTALFKRATLLRRAVLKNWNLEPGHRCLRLSLMPTELHYPFGNKEVVGIGVAVSADWEWETLEEDAVEVAVSNAIEGARIVEGSYLCCQSPREVIRFLYFEVEKVGGGLLTSRERGLLRGRLPAELIASMGTLAHSLFMPRNEEEVLRNLLVLSNELRSRKVPPHVVISFDGVDSERLSFTVILVRLLNENDPAATDIIHDLSDSWKAQLEQDRILGTLGGIKKWGSVFTLSLPNASFLRRDRSVDLNAARASLTSELARYLPGLIDYHGGLILKQEETLAGVRKLLSHDLPLYESMLEMLFYSLSPPIMQSCLPPKLLADLFTRVIRLAEIDFDNERGYQLVANHTAGASMVIIKARGESFIEPLRNAIQQLALDPLQVAQASAMHEGFCFAVYLYLNNDCSWGERLTKAAEMALVEWREQQQGRQVLRLNIPRGASSLDPRIGGDRRSGLLIKMLYEGLMRLEQEGVACGIAHNVTLSDDQRTYTFKLRPSRWSNGDPVTSTDFEYAWKKILDPHFSSRYVYLFYPIKGAEEAKQGKISPNEIGVRAPTPDTLVVELAHPLSRFLELVTHWAYSPLHHLMDKVNPDWADAKGEAYVCNGPFRLSPGSSERNLILTKNPLYWAADRVRLEELEILSIEDPMTILALFEQGQLDWVGDPLMEMPARAFDSIAEKGCVHVRPCSSYYRIALNVECFPFDSKTMRQAFALALDRSAIVRQAGIAGDRPARSLFPPSMELGEDPSLPSYDPRLAQALFKQALDDKKIGREKLPPITLCYPQVGSQVEIAEVIANQWREAFGVQVIVKGYYWADYIERMRGGDFHAAADTFVSWHHDPLYNVKPYCSRSQPLNTTRWEHPEYQRLISEAEWSLNDEQRTALILSAERLILEEGVLIPIFYGQYRYAVREKIRNIFLSGIGQMDFSSAYISSKLPQGENQ